ncbi:kinase-like domain-containing protein [Rhizophagus clarus]|uniref:Kinase-like domain-containing protein n=1 Tax=Rhizophagus clarus TaxID=94130 RepID=A0A8H3LCI5_9GLOM|nr:kinase-like domain-containing protein [Rhizophagus clarus]
MRDKIWKLNREQINTGKDWYYTYNSKRFQQDFNSWTSGNDDIKFIQNIHLLAENHHQILVWITYNKFNKHKYIVEGGFGEVNRATWK